MIRDLDNCCGEERREVKRCKQFERVVILGKMSGERECVTCGVGVSSKEPAWKKDCLQCWFRKHRAIKATPLEELVPLGARAAWFVDGCARRIQGVSARFKDTYEEEETGTVWSSFRDVMMCLEAYIVSSGPVIFLDSNLTYAVGVDKLRLLKNSRFVLLGGQEEQGGEERGVLICKGPRSATLTEIVAIILAG